MALCSITISGTSGLVLINYLDAGSVARTLTAGIGSFSIDDGGSAYTFTTISGDATLTSGCISFTEIPVNCYIMSWELNEFNTLDNATFKFDSVIIDTTEYDTTDVNYPFCNILTLADAVNSLGINEVKATGYKIISGDKNQYFLILQVLGENIPFFKIKNADDTHYLYIKGVYTANCLPAGYTEIQTCEPGTILS